MTLRWVGGRLKEAWSGTRVAMADREAEGPSAKGLSRKYGAFEEGGIEMKGMIELRKKKTESWWEGGSAKEAFW